MRSLVLMLGCVVGLFGQQTNTIYKTLFTNATTLQTTLAITNIGQSNHQVSVSFSNAVGHTCTVPLVSGELEFSYDNTNWIAFGTPTSIANTTLTTQLTNYLWVGAGAFPFVRFKLANFDTTNCVATGYYSGILGGALATQVTGTSPSGQLNTNAVMPVVIGGVSGQSNAISDVVNAASVCVNSFAITENTPGGGIYIQGLGTGTKSIRVCNLTINFTDVQGTIQFYEGSDENNCGGTPGVNITPVFTLSPFVFHNMAGSLGAVIYGGNSTPVTSRALCARTTLGKVVIYGTYAVATTGPLQ